MPNAETWVVVALPIVSVLILVLGFIRRWRRESRHPGAPSRYFGNLTTKGNLDSAATRLSTTGLTPLETFSAPGAYLGSSLFWERLDAPGFFDEQVFRPTLRYVLRSADFAAVAHLRWGYTATKDAFGESAEGRWYFQGLPAAILDPETARRIGLVRRRPIWARSLWMEDGKRYRLQTRMGLRQTFLAMHGDDGKPLFISGQDGTVQILATSSEMSLLMMFVWYLQQLSSKFSYNYGA
jgi:hypothetical protein